MKKIHKVFLIIGIVILSLAVIIAVLFTIFWHNNIHWYDSYEDALKTVNAQEKQVTLPNGNVVNYGEVENDKSALLLIHGQMSIWEDYALVMPELSNKWHIYAVDVYGHGGSSHNESLYYLDVNGDDLIWFIDNVIKAPAVVSGHCALHIGRHKQHSRHLCPLGKGAQDPDVATAGAKHRVVDQAHRCYQSGDAPCGVGEGDGAPHTQQHTA